MVTGGLCDNRYIDIGDVVVIYSDCCDTVAMWRSKNWIGTKLLSELKSNKDNFQLPGFNWSQKDSTTWSDQKTYTVSQDVPGGEKVLYQNLKKLSQRYPAGEKVIAKA